MAELQKRKRATKAEIALRGAQKGAREDMERSLRMYKAIRDHDVAVLAEFHIDPDALTVKQKMDAGVQLTKLATHHLKGMEHVTDEDVSKISKMTGQQVATFQSWATNKPEGAKRAFGIAVNN